MGVPGEGVLFAEAVEAAEGGDPALCSGRGYWPSGAGGYFPLYWPCGYFAAIQEAAGPPASASVELDVRLYDAEGKRLRLPRDWISEVQFEYSERGGYQNGSLQLLIPWEQLQLTGREYADIRLWGQHVYRGFVRTAQNELSVPERASPTLYGLMELLNGYLVRRCLCYGEPTDISQVFLDLAAEYVRLPDRMPDLVLDASGVPALGIVTQSFCARGKTVSQAMNLLCDLAPKQLIWGCDTDAAGRNRFYLRPRAAQVGYRFAIGSKVRAFVYPRDVTRVVNRVYVTGGPGDPPNLAPNASLEECDLPGELAGNLLENPGFETALSVNRFPPWVRINDPTLGHAPVRSGVWALNMDNNPRSPEGVTQTVSIVYPAPLNAACWVWAPAGESWTFVIGISLLDGRGAVLAVNESAPIQPPGDNTFHHYTFTWDAPPAVPATQAMVAYRLIAGSGGGVVLDDCAFWTGRVAAKDWQTGQSLDAGFAQLDWANRDAVPLPYDGVLKARAKAQILRPGGYAELTTRGQSRIVVKAQRTYYLSAWFQPPAGVTAQVAIGARIYRGSDLLATRMSAPLTMTGPSSGQTGGWYPLTYAITTDALASGIDFLVRLLNEGTVYIDALGVFEGAVPLHYYAADRFTARRDVSDYGSRLSPAAAASIGSYGIREKEESVESVTDGATLDAYCIGYFNAHAVPAIQARLEIVGAVAPVRPDGQVQLVNLPSAPPPLFPARIRWQVGASVDLHLDLDSERPNLALLLRQV